MRSHKPNKNTRRRRDAILAEFARQEPPVTVRQMFYRMAALGVVDKAESGYRKVQYDLTNMRRAGEIPFGYIADNTRWVRRPDAYDNLRAAMHDMWRYYRRRLWADQREHVEIWLEKDALAGVVYAITGEYDVPLYVTRGYASMSYLYDAAESLRNIDKPKTVYHFGDYDASGQDAARAIHDGLRDFGATFDFVRAAVTPEQITAMNLQTRPSKRRDPRAKRHGDMAVELDAIPPATLRAMVREVIERHIDLHQLSMNQRIEAQERERLRDFWLSA